MSKKDDNYIGVVLEDIRDQNKAILEAVGSVHDNVAKIPRMLDDVNELKQDLKVVKAAVTDLGSHVHAHDRRITKLEAA